jgi:glycerol-3-phosphate O-acyltransferase
MLNALRDKALTEVEARILDACITQARVPGGLSLDVVVNDTLYHEKKRLETDRANPRWEEDLAFWDGVRSSLGRAKDPDVRKMLMRIIHRYCDEIRGNFSPALYTLATKVLPRGLPLLLNAVSPKRLAARGLPDIGDTVQLEGDTDAIRACARHGTVILAPTHVSNLDSPVMGWAIFALGLPPFSYGAGLNLFSNPVMSLFMRNLGAYRVDRQKTAPLYKDILKEYATVTLEYGQHNLFFPGGTRSRSGAIEQRLKLGLLSAGLRAWINNLRNRKENGRIFIVPCTLNYHLVLEAETLIDEHFQREGKSHYIRTQDESYVLKKYLRFTSNLLNLDSRIRVNLGMPIDPFGNPVDPTTGNSIDHHGRPIDIERYVMVDGVPQHLPQRDRVYTAEAGTALASAFLKYNVALGTQAIAFALFQVLKARNPGLDLYRLLRTGDEGVGVPVAELCEKAQHVARALQGRATRGQLRVEPGPLERLDAAAMLQTALRHFASYHSQPVMTRRGDRVYCEDMKLLHYYANRLKGYGLEKELAPAFADGAGGAG